MSYFFLHFGVTSQLGQSLLSSVFLWAVLTDSFLYQVIICYTRKSCGKHDKPYDCVLMLCKFFTKSVVLQKFNIFGLQFLSSSIFWVPINIAELNPALQKREKTYSQKMPYLPLKLQLFHSKAMNLLMSFFLSV